MFRAWVLSLVMSSHPAMSAKTDMRITSFIWSALVFMLPLVGYALFCAFYFDDWKEWRSDLRATFANMLDHIAKLPGAAKQAWIARASK